MADDKSYDLQLFLMHRSALVDYAQPIVGCRSRAEDVVQEAYIRFAEAGAEAMSRQPIANPAGYLFRIVRNLALDWRRRPAATDRPVPDALDRLADDTPSPEAVALHRDELRVLATALGELPERTRQAFILHRLHGWTLQQIAAHMEISAVRVHQLVKDAILHGASRLEDENG